MGADALGFAAAVAGEQDGVVEADLAQMADHVLGFGAQLVFEQHVAEKLAVQRDRGGGRDGPYTLRCR